MQLYFFLVRLRVKSSRLVFPGDDHLTVNRLFLARIDCDHIGLRIKCKGIADHLDRKIPVTVILINFREVFAVI